LRGGGKKEGEFLGPYSRNGGKKKNKTSAQVHLKKSQERSERKRKGKFQRKSLKDGGDPSEILALNCEKRHRKVKPITGAEGKNKKGFYRAG